MSKNKYRTPTGFKEIKCSKCGVHSVKVDSQSTGAICFRCVSKGINPESVILTDLSQEEYTKFVQKMFNYGRSTSNATKGTV